jgi:hypothetical protein
MSKRTFTFICGLLVGALLRATLIQPAAVEPAPEATAVTHCAAHPVKMPCLFDDSGRHSRT